MEFFLMFLYTSSLPYVWHFYWETTVASLNSVDQYWGIRRISTSWTNRQTNWSQKYFSNLLESVKMVTHETSFNFRLVFHHFDCILASNWKWAQISFKIAKLLTKVYRNVYKKIPKGSCYSYIHCDETSIACFPAITRSWSALLQFFLTDSY